ncbi:MAG: type II toxin-antitoxin system VapC family toxin [Mycobacteriales bacterium]
MFGYPPTGSDRAGVRCCAGNNRHRVPVNQHAAEAAKAILLSGHRLSARDALHLAIMRAHGIETVMSFDSGFDNVLGVLRRY